MGDRSTSGPGSAFFTRLDLSGATDTPRKTNYSFERREREKSKAADSAKKAQAKADKKAAAQDTPDAITEAD